MGKRTRARRESDGPPLEALAGLMTLGPLGYLAAEGTLQQNAHPLHWLVAVAAGVVGYWAGKGVSWWKQR